MLKLISEQEQFPQTKDDLLKRLKYYNIDINQCEINDTDLSVKFVGEVNLSNKNLTYLPIRFSEVIGTFDCSYNHLRTLKGSPKKVLGSFGCSTNELTSLDYSPEFVNGNFYASYNKIKKLNSGPSQVLLDFVAIHNKMTEVSFLPKATSIKLAHNNIKLFNPHLSKNNLAIRHIDLSHNYLDSLENFPTIPNLMILNLGYNKIKSIKTVAKFKILNSLTLSNNYISEFKNYFSTKLIHLDLENNKIVNFDIQKLNKLESLNLLGNPQIEYKQLLNLNPKLDLSLHYQQMPISDQIKFCKKFINSLPQISGDDSITYKDESLWPNIQEDLLNEMNKRRQMLAAL